MLSGELLYDVSLQYHPAWSNAVCAGPGHILMVAGWHPVGVTQYSSDGEQLRRTVDGRQPFLPFRRTVDRALGVFDERERCRGIGATDDSMLIATARRLYSCRITQ